MIMGNPDFSTPDEEHNREPVTIKPTHKVWAGHFLERPEVRIGIILLIIVIMCLAFSALMIFKFIQAQKAQALNQMLTATQATAISWAATQTAKPTFTPSNTPTSTFTPTKTPTPTITRTQVPTRTPLPTRTPTIRPDSTKKCSGALPSKLEIGDRAEVNYYQVSVRAAPGFSSHKEHVLAQGRVITIIDGHECADRAVWWKIHFAGTISSGKYQEYDGWMPEVDYDSRYLVRLP
jgi:hypothetical protein